MPHDRMCALFSGRVSNMPLKDVIRAYGRKFEVHKAAFEKKWPWLAAILPISNGCVLRVWLPRPVESESNSKMYYELLNEAPIMSDDRRLETIALRVSSFEIIRPKSTRGGTAN